MRMKGRGSAVTPESRCGSVRRGRCVGTRASSPSGIGSASAGGGRSRSGAGSGSSKRERSMADHEIFDVIRAGNKARLETLLASDRQLVNVRNESGHSPVLIAQYHHKHDLVAVLLAAGPTLDVFD